MAVANISLTRSLLETIEIHFESSLALAPTRAQNEQQSISRNRVGPAKSVQQNRRYLIFRKYY